MITIAELNSDISELEKKPASYQNCERLAVLYTLQERLLQKSAGQLQTAAPSRISAESSQNIKGHTKSITETSGNNILPAYKNYIEIKRQYQQGVIAKENVLKNLEVLSDEIKDFIRRLYRNSDMPEERNILSKTIAEINVGNL